MKLSESALVERMHRAYLRRLHEVLGESEVMWRDSPVISPGLKVHHTESGIVYTVKDVIKDAAGNVVSIRLRKPDVPRFDPSGEEFVGETSEIPHIKRKLSNGEIIAKEFNLSSPTRETVFEVSEEDFNSAQGTDGDLGDTSDTIVVDKKTFESEYSIKTSG